MYDNELEGKVDLLLKLVDVNTTDRVVQAVLDNMTAAEKRDLVKRFVDRIEPALDRIADREVGRLASAWVENEATKAATAKWATVRTRIVGLVDQKMEKYISLDYVGQIVDHLAPPKIKEFVRDQIQAILKPAPR